MTEVKLIKTQRVLSATQIDLADYVINPYRGCEFGCLYCYSQENKNIKRQQKPWGKFLEVKINAPQILKQELKTKKPARVLIGSTTECFQYCEKRYKITSGILQILNQHNISYTILTKSHLVKDYLDIISANSDNKIYFTLNVAQQQFIDLLELKTPNINQRLTAINAILEHNINLRLHLGPFIPYISNLREIMELIPPQVTEIDIELYHYRLGQFNTVLNKINNQLGPDLKQKIKNIYTSKKQYQQFSQQLKAQIKKIKQHSARKFFFIVPDFDKFYLPTITYHDQL